MGDYSVNGGVLPSGNFRLGSTYDKILILVAEGTMSPFHEALRYHRNDSRCVCYAVSTALFEFIASAIRAVHVRASYSMDGTIFTLPIISFTVVFS